ncbi:hypothetical protein RND81_06G172000 [Saponaria officinalis]|uniref:Transmembrane protein n=1 Tax=Saponaria officinalis TaxID=3572 RepID=A0AAW1KCP6_SAPOF
MKRSSLPYVPKCIFPLIPIILDSLKIIFLDNLMLFIIIYIVAALPTSIIITNLSISATPRRLKAYMMRLEWLSRVVPTLQETKNVWRTSQDELQSLLHFRMLHAFPMLVFSLVTVITTVTLTSLAVNRKTEELGMSMKKCPVFWAVFTALKVKWTWPFISCIINYFILIMWGHVLPILTTMVGYPVTIVVTGVGLVLEVYLMSLFSLSLVISVEEERVGLGFFSFGSGIMKGMRVCGWVLSAFILLCTNLIGREMVMIIDSQDLEINGNYSNWTREMRIVNMMGLVFLLGWIVLWSNVVFTLFYYDCRERIVIREAFEKGLNSDIDI